MIGRTLFMTISKFPGRKWERNKTRHPNWALHKGWIEPRKKTRPKAWQWEGARTKKWISPHLLSGRNPLFLSRSVVSQLNTESPAHQRYELLSLFLLLYVSLKKNSDFYENKIDFRPSFFWGKISGYFVVWWLTGFRDRFGPWWRWFWLLGVMRLWWKLMVLVCISCEEYKVDKIVEQLDCLLYWFFE